MAKISQQRSEVPVELLYAGRQVYVSIDGKNIRICKILEVLPPDKDGKPLLKIKIPFYNTRDTLHIDEVGLTPDQALANKIL